MAVVTGADPMRIARGAVLYCAHTVSAVYSGLLSRKGHRRAAKIRQSVVACHLRLLPGLNQLLKPAVTTHYASCRVAELFERHSVYFGVVGYHRLAIDANLMIALVDARNIADLVYAGIRESQSCWNGLPCRLKIQPSKSCQTNPFARSNKG